MAPAAGLHPISTALPAGLPSRRLVLVQNGGRQLNCNAFYISQLGSGIVATNQSCFKLIEFPAFQ